MSSASEQLSGDLGWLIGQNIEVRENGQIIDFGCVEDITEDGLILWLSMEGTRGRRLIEIGPYRELKILPNKW